MGVTERFHRLHDHGFFVMPNAWDVGSAVRLQRMGFAALATTSSGHAWSLGKEDGDVTFDELCEHVDAVTAAVSIPVSVDAERLFASTLDGVAENVRVLADVGAAGMSIEDYDGARDVIDPIEVATERVAAAADAARESGVVLTARAENLIRGVPDLEDTVHRLLAYARAGASCVYAPGLVDPADIAHVVDSVDVPVNVLLRPNGPTLVMLADLGVRRVSVGGRLARVAYDAMEHAAAELLGVSPPPP